MEAVSRRLVRPVLLAGLLFAGAGLMGAGFAGAGTLEAMLGGQLLPSAAPALLGPITETGRKGWDCRPERAAAAATSQDAELPSPSQP